MSGGVAGGDGDLRAGDEGADVGLEAGERTRDLGGELGLSDFDEVFGLAAQREDLALKWDNFEDDDGLTFEAGDRGEFERNRAEPKRLSPAFESGDERVLRVRGAEAGELVEKRIPRRHDNVSDATLLDEREGFVGRVGADDATGGGHAVLVFPAERGETAEAAVEAQRGCDGGRSENDDFVGGTALGEPVGEVAFDEPLNLHQCEHVILILHASGEQRSEGEAECDEKGGPPGKASHGFRGGVECGGDDGEEREERGAEDIPPPQAGEREGERERDGADCKGEWEAETEVGGARECESCAGEEEENRSEESGGGGREALAGEPGGEVLGERAVEEVGQTRDEGIGGGVFGAGLEQRHKRDGSDGQDSEGDDREVAGRRIEPALLDPANETNEEFTGAEPGEAEKGMDDFQPPGSEVMREVFDEVCGEDGERAADRPCAPRWDREQGGGILGGRTRDPGGEKCACDSADKNGPVAGNAHPKTEAAGNAADEKRAP